MSATLPDGRLDVFVDGHRTRLLAHVDVVELPVGTTTLARGLRGDPPQPEELTNAIGLVADHLDDLLREAPQLATASPVRVHGTTMAAIAAVEIGSTATPDAITLHRAAAEDVFRTLATETTADRRHNPGLPAHLVDEIVGGCCLLVALMRSLHLDSVEVVCAASRAPTASPGGSA